MANMLEGGGKTPVLAPEELEVLGFKLVAYPLSLLGVSIRAMQSALQLLKVHLSMMRSHLPRQRPVVDGAQATDVHRNKHLLPLH